MSRTYRRKNSKMYRTWRFFISQIEDLVEKIKAIEYHNWRFHSDCHRKYSQKMLKKLTARRSRREPIVYDEETDESTTKYHRHDDKWNYD